MLEHGILSNFSILLTCSSNIFSLPLSPSENNMVLELERSSKYKTVDKELVLTFFREFRGPVT